MNTLSVRKLAEFVFRSGDLYPPSQGLRVDAVEGIETQQKLQQARSENDPAYEAEVSVKQQLTLQKLLLPNKVLPTDLSVGVCLNLFPLMNG